MGYRFATADGMVELAQDIELKNCWCQTENADAAVCDDWFCGTLEHKEWCHGRGDFAVDGFGRFGCNDAECAEWFGFFYHGKRHKYNDRDEYRCECVGDDCLSSICGLKQIPVRKNWMFWNFPLALIVWGCFCGCCGTRMCFKKRGMYETGRFVKYFRCRCCRMLLFFAFVGAIALYHGGVPAFLFFCILFCLSLCCAVKREKYGRCGRGMCCGSKYKRSAVNCETKMYETICVNETDVNGENSKDESVQDVEMKAVGVNV